jgi:FtsP/CotA-like multicopper oxidase with cupredoxin domain
MAKEVGVQSDRSAMLPCLASMLKLEPGKTYRLRFVGATALTFASIAIEDRQDLKVIEADGSITMPVNTSFLQLGSGQRYSVLLNTKVNPERQYISSRLSPGDGLQSLDHMQF